MLGAAEVVIDKASVPHAAGVGVGVQAEARALFVTTGEGRQIRSR